ncbi:hypothetical protein BJF78_33410 [Pseudonocardia sp. CNS-139]|nr:hypothetical protein BJF78_33410 [Pseudonocardia sp. CNS-139]
MRCSVDRRAFLAGGLGLVTLAACGAGPQAPAPPVSRDFRVGDAVVQIPVNPQRVVTISTFTQDAMFDLGTDPVGVYDPGEQYILAAYRQRWAAIPKVSGGSAGGALDLERIASLTPDLILGIDAQQAPLDRLSRIAPTVLLPFTGSPTIWRELTDETADAVNRTGVLDPLAGRYTARARAIAQQHAAVLERTRFAILQGGFEPGAFWLYGPGSSTGAVLADAACGSRPAPPP